MYLFEAGGREYAYSPIDNKIVNYDAKLNVFTDVQLATQYIACHNYEYRKMSMFTIEVTQQCNLRCRYCCYSGSYDNRRKHNNLFLTNDKAMQCVYFIKEHADIDAEQITICFYGGEALLVRKQIEFVIKNLRKQMPYTKFLFSISTNGTLLTQSVSDWICSDKDIIATITIDGNRKMNDKNRVMLSGKGTFDVVMKNLRSFYNRHPNEFYRKVQFISTLKSPDEIVNLNDFWMNDILLQNSRPLHISMIMPNKRVGETVWFDERSYDEMLAKALESLVRRKENVLTDELLKLISRIQHRSYNVLPQAQSFKSCINEPYSCFITAEGDLYICEKFCKGLSIGSLSDGISFDKCRSLYDKFLSKKKQFCSSCWAQRLCRICALCLNDERSFLEYCNVEKIRIGMAMKYYCEFLKAEKTYRQVPQIWLQP